MSDLSAKKEKKKERKEKKERKKEKKEKKRAREGEAAESSPAVAVEAATPKQSEVAAVKKQKSEDHQPRQPRIYPLSPIAAPLASEKEQTELYALVKAACAAKRCRRGVKEVQKALRKKEKGLMVFAGDVEPMDVISHLPVMCEDENVPYVFVRSREELGVASSTKRPVSCILVKSAADYEKQFNACVGNIKPLKF